MIFQDANLLPWRNLQKNIELPFELKRKPPDQRADRQAARRASALPASRTSMPRELSGGMQQRASIVRSLAVNPSVLLMDEPFGALDAFTRDEMNLLIQEIWMETGKTIAFVTHSIAEAIFLADRVAVMSARPGPDRRNLSISTFRGRAPSRSRREPDFIERVLDIKVTHRARHAAGMPAWRSPEDRTTGGRSVDKALGDKIPEFNKKRRAAATWA